MLVLVRAVSDLVPVRAVCGVRRSEAERKMATLYLNDRSFASDAWKCVSCAVTKTESMPNTVFAIFLDSTRPPSFACSLAPSLPQISINESIINF